MSGDAHETLVDKVALCMERDMFADHELPLDVELHNKYRFMARAVIALIAEETKEPSAIMEDTASVLPSTRMLSRAFWISMHRVSVLWPKDAQS